MIRDYAIASGTYPIVVAATLGEIRIKAGGAARRGNVSRAQLAAKKAEYKALVANGQSTGDPWMSHRDDEQSA